MTATSAKNRCFWATGVPDFYEQYHDEEWGVPCFDEHKMFEMLILEGAQAGLSWQTVLAKRETYRKAFDQFDVEKIAKYSDAKVQKLMLDAGIIPIVAGGGGIPVVKNARGDYHGVPAVIDKDYTSAMLAAQLKADAFVMVTGVEQVALDFGKPTQRNLAQMNLHEARAYAAQGQFPPGSMGPKIGAAIDFLSAAQNPSVNLKHAKPVHAGRVIITSLNKVFDAVEDGAGTQITL